MTICMGRLKLSSVAISVAYSSLGYYSCLYYDFPKSTNRLEASNIGNRFLTIHSQLMKDFDEQK